MDRSLLCCATLSVLLLGGVTCPEPLVRRRAVPVIYVCGSHYDVGFDVGRTFAALIRSFVSSYGNLRGFEREYKSPAGRAAYERTLANMRRRHPYYVREMQGIADGSGVPFQQLFLLQMDDLIGNINDVHVPRNDTGGCSSIGLLTPHGAVLGHTEDAFAETLNHFYIVSAHVIPTPEDAAAGAVEERFASLCYAGHLPGYTMGYNENGLVFSINTLSPMVLKPGNTPRTFITRALLASKNLSDAKRVLTDEGLGVGNGFSVNMVWSEEGGARALYNVEVAPDLAHDRSLINVHRYETEPLVHCNLYQRLQVKEVIGPIIDSSKERLRTIHAHAPPLARADIADVLSDDSGTTFQVFQHKPDSVIKTIAAGIFDLEQMSWSIYINQPNASEPVAVLPIRFSSLEGQR
ncbi:uncharacterized protein LOC126379941 isoform X2 [Pectinophora gossypiella]|uniref:uncharacterized protein LOC126379941 isoform X2 n=1 Tax=Pectinophora gossypiella TaxID=13191 RepID=UPI00214E4E64|nr:uncharacterized protein LOC126379941 isoform X2 [Pectinophora gossypiella]